MHWTLLSGGIRVLHDDSYNICVKSDVDEWGETRQDTVGSLGTALGLTIYGCGNECRRSDQCANLSLI